MLCPNCKTNLLLSERQGIEIDYCPDCRGIWLDRGELDKILERSAEQQQTAYTGNELNDNYRNRKYDEDYSKDYYKKKHNKSFLSDLFDF
ncbi:MAG: zf-TFIIB domain-containing protein [Bacillota bacterium]